AAASCCAASGRGGDRQLEPDSGPTASRSGPDTAAVRLDDLADDRQPDARPSGRARARSVHAVEALPDGGQLAIGDLASRVLNLTAHAAILGPQADRDL